MATSRPSRLLRYLTSTKNLVGSALALVGLVLFFTGVVGQLWPVVVVGLYLVGALITPNRTRYDPPEPGGFDADQVRTQLADQVRAAQGRLPPATYDRLVGIQRTIVTGILPQVAELPPGSQDLFVVQRTASDYLPAAIQSYLRLPPDYATSKPILEGKTSAQILDQQLALLGEKLEEVAEALNRQDSDRLIANGRFLEERFARGDLTLPEPDQR